MDNILEKMKILEDKLKLAEGGLKFYREKSNNTERFIWALVDSNSGELKLNRLSLESYDSNCSLESYEDFQNYCLIIRSCK